MELALQSSLAARRSPSQRLFFVDVPPAKANAFAESVAEGLALTQKQVNSRYLYDEIGSQLFEEITGLPEYGLTRCENAILSRKAGEIVESVGREISVVELGSGSSQKTRHILRAALRRQGQLLYAPIDISRDFLHRSATTLVHEFERLLVTAVAGEYFDALLFLAPAYEPRLFLFLGSNLGNNDPEGATHLLSDLAATMTKNDRLLVGMDLLKDPSETEAAYNDEAGVTAQFNKNLLARINRELGGEFDLEDFAHHAPFVHEQGRIEMRLVSRRTHDVAIRGLETTVSFEAGEYILTEISTKPSIKGMVGLCESAGMSCIDVFFDPRQRFAEFLLAKRS